MEQVTPAPVPTAFVLAQNYPNPFNPVTEITYELPTASTVFLKIYNILGEEIKTLVNSKAQTAGIYTVAWDGRDDDGVMLGSGIYFYKLTAGNEVKIRRMLKIH